MHGSAHSRLTATAIAVVVLFAAHAAHAQNVTVHGTVTSWQSTYLATQAGNVGIGLTNPFVKLHVWGNDPANVIARVENANATGSARVVVVGNSNTLTSSFLQIVNAGAGTLAGGSILFYDSWTSARAAIKVRTSSTAIDSGAMTLFAGGQGLDGMDGQLTILPNGNVGIDIATPTRPLHVNGQAQATAWLTPSSRTLKENIHHLAAQDYTRILSELARIDPAHYQYRPDAARDRGRHLGFIAEELPAEVLSPDGTAVDVYALASYGLAASKALLAQNAALTSEVRELRRELAEQRRAIAKLAARSGR